jgi:hypothetical protein
MNVSSPVRELPMGKGGRSYRFNLRVLPEWMDRVRAAAGQRGISMADFVIMTVNERLGTVIDASEAEAAPKKGKGKK